MIRRKIAKLLDISQEGKIATADVLRWSISETWHEWRRSILLWATQSTRHQWQEVAWNQAGSQGGPDLYAEIASRFLEDESQSLGKRYSPSTGAAKGILEEELQDLYLAERSRELKQIKARCEEFVVPRIGAGNFNGGRRRTPDQETVLYGAIRPITSCRRGKVRKNRRISTESRGFRPAFMALKDSSVARLVDLSQFSREILVTEGFVRTVKPGPPPYTYI